MSALDDSIARHPAGRKRPRQENEMKKRPIPPPGWTWARAQDDHRTPPPCAHKSPVPWCLSCEVTTKADLNEPPVAEVRCSHVNVTGSRCTRPTPMGRVVCVGPHVYAESGDDPVNHPSHYTAHPSGVECIQVTEHMTFCLGNAVKYIWRAGSKGDAIEDLRKARWYIDREIERLGGAS